MAYERTLQEIDNFVFDLDGTVWEWNRLKDGVKETIVDLADRGKDIYYITNSAMLSREGYADKLRDFGLPVERDSRVISASYIASEIFDAKDIRKAFVIGEEGLMDELGRNGIAHSEEAGHVLVAVDRNFSYWKMAKAADLIRAGADLWATSIDSYWWAGDRAMPGTNALTAAVKLAADTDDVEVVGKPSAYARDVVTDEWGLRPTNTILIGDNLSSDIVLGNKIGCKTALVLGGASTEEDLNDAGPQEKPHIVFRSFDRIMMKV